MNPSPGHSESPLSPGITVIIPVFNRAGIVGETLRSLQAQTRWPERVILVDNASTDDSLAVISRWAEERRAEGRRVDVITEKRPGAAAARKSGEKMVDTRYLYFFDSDDVMRPDLIERIMKDFEADPALMLTAWPLVFHNPDGTTWQRIVHPRRPLENHLVQGLLSTQAYAADTRYFRSVGGWNPELGGWDDWELGLRLLLGGGKIKVSTEPRADIRVHEASISGLTYLHGKGDWEKAIDKTEEAAGASDSSLRPYIMRLLAYKRAILAAHYRREGLPAHETRGILAHALKSPALSRFHKTVIRMAYGFTAMGLRGAGMLFPPLLASKSDRKMF